MQLSSLPPRETLTVARTLLGAAERFGENEALVMDGVHLTYRELLLAARRRAGGLLALGLQPGDHFGLLMPNCLEYLLLFHACALVGIRPVHLNSRYKAEDLRYVIRDSDIRFLVTSARQREFADFEGMLRELYPELAGWQYGQPLSIAAAPRLEALFQLDVAADHPWGAVGNLLGEAVDPPAYNRDPEQIALIMYTSGTTAEPKACLLSHRALEGAGHALAERFRMQADDRFWDPLPFFHMSTMLPMACCRASGATFIGVGHFEPGPAVQEIVTEQATVLFPSFPTLTNALFTHPDFSPEALHKVRLVNNVGPPDLLRRFAAQLPGAVHVTAYGLTEAGGVIAFNELDDTLDQRVETSGRPMLGSEVRIVDAETGEVCAQGGVGEIQIRGETLFSGYHNDAKKTGEVFADGGWLRSGDLGALDVDGRIRYLGRLKDMLKVGGENVAAVEIESFLCTLPGVRVAQVISVPDNHLMEVAAAFIELAPDAVLSAEDVVRACLGRIASYKIPRYVYFVAEWPMSATKIQKFRLREQVHSADRIELAKYR